MSLENTRVWFITGSSQGIGRALVEELLASGERVVATLRKPSALASLAERYPTTQLLILPLDVTRNDQITTAFEDTKKHFGRLDVVVNNAGFGLLSELETTPDEEARKQVEVLFWGPVNICKQAIPFMRDVNPPGAGGLIMNVSTIGGYSANAGLAFYSSGKFALEGFTEALNKEMIPSWNIKAVILELGGFRTEWAGSSMITLPSLPIYTTDDAPSEQMRRLLGHKAAAATGDPKKSAKAFIKLANEKNKLPLRVQLGTDSSLIVSFKAKQTLEDAKVWEDFAASTNANDVDKEQLVQQLKFSFS
ncbi:short-chain dehydrogenases/reductases (SDR) family protein [Abortiporus biennis]